MGGQRFLMIGARLALLGFVLLVTFVLAEALLRLVMPLNTAGYHAAYQYDEKFGYRLKSGRHYLVLSDHLQELRTNALGTVNFQETFDPYEKLVFALGDSYTQGTGLAADEAYPFQLDLILNLEASGYEQRWGVVNLGLAAFGMEQSMLALDEYASVIGTPSVVLFLGCTNDNSDDQLFESGYRHRHLVDGSPSYGIWLGPLSWFTNETEIGRRLKLMRSKIRRRAIVADRDADSGSAPPPLSVAAQQEARFDRLLAQTRAMGARLIVSWTDWDEPPGGSYAWLKEWAAENSVDFADWHREAHAVRDRIPNAPRTNPHSAGHYRAWVNQIIARAYADEISKAHEAASADPAG